MKTNTKIALLAALGLTLASIGALAQSDSSEPTSLPPVAGPHGRPAPGVLLLTLLDKYDTNHDGQLDATEMANLRKDVKDGKIQPPGGGKGPGEAAGMRQPPTAKELIAQFDTDKDGKLDAAELEALLKFLHEHRPPMLRGGHGHGGPPEGADGAGGPPPGADAPQQ